MEKYQIKMPQGAGRFARFSIKLHTSDAFVGKCWTAATVLNIPTLYATYSLDGPMRFVPLLIGAVVTGAVYFASFNAYKKWETRL